ncbi:hypothetical protein GH714_012519 [Hevea brasiliensis]|uniref:Sialate O-acetylesterase domain-containing protein n=1 Tax=Hevea brasiliensis TaxID=3981 RepID=A0A6A6NGN4_HEVBR|nr:hypothetical protein GH714_012519 [Hevea brasiliensis]
MAGRGGVINNTKIGKLTWDGIVPPQCQPNPSIFRLSANLTWVLAHEPLHADIDYNKTNGIGPGMAFANAVLTKDPTIGVGLASGEGPFTETIREAQLGINLPNVQCVDAKGLPLEPDRLHLTTPAQVQLGQMLAHAFLQSLSTPIRTSINSATALSFLASDNFVVGYEF